MTIIIFDVETTGRDPRQARLVQIAALHLADDFTTLGSLNEIVIPQGFDIPPETTAIHGIDTETARRKGIPLHEALDRFIGLLEAADARMLAGRLVAHNFQYDHTVCLYEFERAGRQLEILGQLQPFCTMKSMTERCGLPGRYGKPKWPTLNEAYIHCFNQLPDEDERGHAAHSAMGDVLSCRDIFVHGVEQGWWR